MGERLERRVAAPTNTPILDFVVTTLSNSCRVIMSVPRLSVLMNPCPPTLPDPNPNPATPRLATTL